MSFGPGGMPRSRHQQRLDDILVSSSDLPQPVYARVDRSTPSHSRTNTMSSIGRRVSSASSKNIFTGWKNRNKSQAFDEDDGYMEDDFIDQGPNNGSASRQR